MEFHFVLARFTIDNTKYHHIPEVTPEDVAIKLSMEIEGYSSLKDSITQVYQKSKTELIENALGEVSLDEQKPSVCLRRIPRKRSECHLTMNNDEIKHRFMQAMPNSMFSPFSAHLDLPSDKSAKLADTIYGYLKDIFQDGHTFTPPTFIVIVLCTPAATKAKKQHDRQQYLAILTRTMSQNLRLSSNFANSAKRC